MTKPTRIRASVNGEVVDVRILMSHAMETGLRKDPEGNPIAPWFIQEVVVRSNDRTVLAAQWGTAVSRNPYLQFAFKGGRAGDTITVEWKDNRGESRTDSATVE